MIWSNNNVTYSKYKINNNVISFSNAFLKNFYVMCNPK